MTFLKRIVGAAALGVTLLLGAGPIASPVQAGYVVTLEEIRGVAGIDVIATGSGSINLTGLIFVPDILLITGSFIAPAVGAILTGAIDFPVVDTYTGFTGPTSFGSGGRTLADDSSIGDAVGIDALEFIFVPAGYGSGNPLSSSAIWLNQTFSTLGVTPGIYEWTWGAGPDQNFTLVIHDPDSVPVPEPASAALLGMALAGLLLARTHRRTRPEMSNMC